VGADVDRNVRTRLARGELVDLLAELQWRVLGQLQAAHVGEAAALEERLVAVEVAPNPASASTAECRVTMFLLVNPD
jgi:hypothetical protein